MAKSKYVYVKSFEHEDNCLPHNWIVVRIDGRNFSEFSDCHQFIKPNDLSALELMNRAAMSVMEEFREIVIAYGQSDEYSFVFRKDTTLFKRRASKLSTNVATLFASSYVFHWPLFFKDRKLHYPPSFHSKVFLFPTENLRDYLSWRQDDAHNNNLYNTCFWNLTLKKQMTPQEAEEQLSGTLPSHKNELLFQEFGLNYNKEPAIFRRGTTLVRKLVPNGMGRLKPTVIPLTDDIIGNKFWKENPEILSLKSLGTYQSPAKNVSDVFDPVQNDLITTKPTHQENIIDSPIKSVTSGPNKHETNGEARKSVRTKVTKSKYDSSKSCEVKNKCSPNNWIVVRIDGRNFSKFCDCHQFTKPNDLSALELMNRAAMSVMEEFREIVIAYGQSDEYSFVFRKDTTLFERQVSELTSIIGTLFATSYIFYWPQFFKNRELHYPPGFDARAVLYPSDKNLRDYLAWRQADVHFNNSYNTCFWNLVLKKHMTPQQAEERLSGTVSSQKKELLLKDFDLNYENEPAMFRKGTTLVRKLVPNDMGHSESTIIPLTDDIIGDGFWKDNPEFVGLESLGIH